ncbi:MAG TPA: PTS sugar transporter subunit IIA [Quisquiliibacterium sp.]|mgnify:FL=1|nr:MAG: PTS sugar transporter subunit IIA [Burkholderiaceae bacterium]HOA92744.1 PTS sugar transporter subunit IIA [Quisquiliibacterium sp.]HPA88571.1 PTS sugar transporter subunit IIA [Quisquiliibacterium sp.]HQD81584.1 PTS sugar transporter subunit IIA [Quisquiliibacterium sp.]HQN10851.1 PTS sugar transporter subunit IIA [Quisquiliibacterium sp.]
MNRIARLMPPTNVVTNLSVTSKKRLFEQAGLLFENNHGIERSKVFDSLFARERLGSTGLGEGVAIPHGRIKGLKEALAAVVRLAEPIPFDAPDDQPVRLLVFLLVPEHATEEHLEILSELAELLSDRSIRESLLTCEDPAQVHRILATWTPYRPAA